MGATVSVHEDDVDHVLEGVPCLVRVLSCDHPFDPPARIVLDGIDRVRLGRSTTHADTREGSELVIGVADDRTSTEHARLHRQQRRFVIEDCGSKNGTIVNGRRVEAPTDLADGDVIEVGHTFFLYRARVPRGVAQSPTTIANHTTEALPLTTFVPGLARQFERLAKVALSTIPIVVLGETGSGKEVVANAVHRLSGRPGPFLALNCGAIPATLVESTLFGARKGAFSGAVEDRPGLVRSADGGTLFLDEIGELPLPAQIALLRVLQEQEVMPLGATKPVKVDVRIVAATHRALDRMVDANRFRADLFARLGGLTVNLPGVRDRREDLGLIIAGVLRRITPDFERVRIGRTAARALFVYPFPHNIRELEKALGLAIAIAHTDEGPIELELSQFPEELRVGPRASATSPAETPGENDDERKAHLVALLEQHRGRVADVARAMGKARMQIHRWIQKYEIDLESYRKA
jgi:transcriptional regulator with PAS, ATPase and Fis domain